MLLSSLLSLARIQLFMFVTRLCLDSASLCPFHLGSTAVAAAAAARRSPPAARSLFPAFRRFSCDVSLSCPLSRSRFACVRLCLRSAAAAATELRRPTGAVHFGAEACVRPRRAPVCVSASFNFNGRTFVERCSSHHTGFSVRPEQMRSLDFPNFRYYLS